MEFSSYFPFLNKAKIYHSADYRCDFDSAIEQQKSCESQNQDFWQLHFITKTPTASSKSQFDTVKFFGCSNDSVRSNRALQSQSNSQIKYKLDIPRSTNRHPPLDCCPPPILLTDLVDDPKHEKHPKLLHHCSYRPRQIDACRPAHPSLRRRYPKRISRSTTRFDGHRA